MSSATTTVAEPSHGQPDPIGHRRSGRSDRPSRYKWFALSNTTLGVLMATINSSIVIISLPAIFRGIHLNPLTPSNISYLLWIIMGYLLVQAVLVVTLGRLGDMFGRVKIYNAGFAVFTVGSILLALDPFQHASGALWLIAWRVLQGIGGAMLMANSTAILTDAFPVRQRGMSLGINSVAGIGGSFIGFILGGLLSEVDWRAVFFVSVPIGLAGTVWAYLSLREVGVRKVARIDWWGNILFAVGLTALLAGITYGIQPYGGHDEGWTNPWVLGAIIGGIVLLAVFCLVETRVAQPMFHIGLYKTRAFTTANIASLMSAVARGGLQFMLIIWLQGIWLPLHGYNFVDTPLWAAIYMLPLTFGFLVAGPVSGYLSDRFGARAFATGGLLLVAVTFGGLLVIPTVFTYWQFAIILFLNGVGSGLFAAPNTTAIMNSVPADQRGAANGMRTTLMNSGMALSIGVFFSLMITGLAAKLPHSLYAGLTSQGVPTSVADRIAGLPPVGTLFAAFLGYNPIGSLLGPQVLSRLPSGNAATLTGKEFFPHLVAGPFSHGLYVVFLAAIVMTMVGAVASLLRGGIYIHEEHEGSKQGGTRGPSTPATAHAAAGTPAPGGSPVWGERVENGRAGMRRPGHTSNNEREIEGAHVAEETSPLPGPEQDPLAQAPDADGGDRRPTITGHVYQPSHSPLAEAVLTLTDLQGGQVDRARTGVDGAYQLTPRAGGTYILICTAGDYQPRASLVAVADRTVVRDVVLAGAGSTVSGHVRAAGSGDPLPAVTLTITDVRGEVVATTTSDEQGGYAFPEVTEGAYTLTAHAPRLQPVAASVTVPAGAHVEHDVELTGHTRLSGVVRAGRSGKPVEEAIVTLLDAAGSVVSTQVTGPDGEYVFEDLPEGAYTLTASGYPPVATSLQVSTGALTDHDVALGVDHRHG